LCGVKAFVTPFVDEPFIPEHRPEMLHSLTVSLLGGSYVVCIGYVAAAEEMFEPLRHISAEGQGIFPRSLGSLLDFQAMLICS